MQNIKPIETVYNGYRFRSRLEAKWAVYFDLLHIKYEYEPEGYVLDDGKCYLPDFYLPEVNTFFEVKPLSTNGNDVSLIKEKLESLAEGKNCFTMLCRGDPVDNCIIVYLPYMKMWTSAEVMIRVDVADDFGFECYQAFDRGFVAGNRYSKKEYECKTINGNESKLLLPFNKVYSYGRIPFEEQEAARQARFEYGESGT